MIYTKRYNYSMKKQITWNEEKNQLLQIQRGISFEMIEEKIVQKDILDIRDHPNKVKYPNQKILIMELNGYIYFVPFVEDEYKYFLKSIIPSRKLNKEFKKDKS